MKRYVKSSFDDVERFNIDYDDEQDMFIARSDMVMFGSNTLSELESELYHYALSEGSRNYENRIKHDKENMRDPFEDYGYFLIVHTENDVPHIV